MTPIVDPYLRIQRALNVDTVAGIKDDARRIADRGRHARIESGAAMQAAAAELQQAADLTAARTAFARLSDAVIQHAQGVRRRASADEVKVALLPDGPEVLAAEGRRRSRTRFTESRCRTAAASPRRFPARSKPPADLPPLPIVAVFPVVRQLPFQ